MTIAITQGGMRLANLPNANLKSNNTAAISSLTTISVEADFIGTMPQSYRLAC